MYNQVNNSIQKLPDDQKHNPLGILVTDLYLDILCSEISNPVYEFLGFKEIITIFPFICHKLLKRIHSTVPVFNKLIISDWKVSFGSDFITYLGNNNIFTENSLFKYKNLNGLKLLHIECNKLLFNNDWLKSISWNKLSTYLNNISSLDTVIIGNKQNEQSIFCPSLLTSNSIKYNQSLSNSNQFKSFVSLFKSLINCKTFVVETSPFIINEDFILNLSETICDLRLYDDNIIWNTQLLNTIKSHFINLKSLTIPIDSINNRDLITFNTDLLQWYCDKLVFRSIAQNDVNHEIYFKIKHKLTYFNYTKCVSDHDFQLPNFSENVSQIRKTLTDTSVSVKEKILTKNKFEKRYYNKSKRKIKQIGTVNGNINLNKHDILQDVDTLNRLKIYKQIKRTKRKLHQIKALENKRKNGEKLLPNQIEKINNKNDFKLKLNELHKEKRDINIKIRSKTKDITCNKQTNKELIECDECIICMDNERSYACIPCGHYCLCEKCKGIICGNCPICQNKCKVYRIYK